MNTKNIVNKICFHELEQLDIVDFLMKIYNYRTHLFNDINFIDYFKDRGSNFWYLVILCSKIPLVELKLNYFDYLNDKDLLHQVNDRKRQLNSFFKNKKKDFDEKFLKELKRQYKIINEYVNLINGSHI